MKVPCRALALLVALPPAVGAQTLGDDGRWYAGAYSYSADRNAFLIVAVSGTGTRDDPVHIVQEFSSASPVTLVVRAAAPIVAHGTVGEHATGMLHMRISTLNNSGLPWIEYEFEVQEQYGLPSTFGDGLSFDQAGLERDVIGSDRFRRYSRDFEPYDRLLFTEGHVDPLETVTFDFFISDFTPTFEFFLVQNPMVPFS